MNIKFTTAKSILTPQSSGFLTHKPYPYTHTLSPYIGCAYGVSACGSYCYAPTLPAWQHQGEGEWGKTVIVKQNAADILRDTLRKCKDRSALRIFFSPATDPWQVPAESKHFVTRSCLQVFAEFDDLGLLVMQTRSPLAERDLDLLINIPYVWLSVTLETDLQSEISKLGHPGSSLQGRRRLITTAVGKIPVQIAVSPCLPHSNQFANQLVDLRPNRVIVDNFMEGDGDRGKRTAASPFAKRADYDWQRDTSPQKLLEQLRRLGQVATWSSEGFCSIPSRESAPKPLPPRQLGMFDGDF